MNDPLGLFEEDKGSDPLGLFSDEEKQPSRLRKIAGAGEAALNIGSGLIGQIPAGIGTIIDTVNELTQGRHDPKKAEQRFQDLSRAFTYEPRTEEGKEYVEKIMTPDVMNTLNALGGIAHTMPPARTAPSVRSLIPKDTPIPTSRLDKLNELTKPKETEAPKQDPLALFEGQGELDLFSPDQKQLGQSPFDAVGGKWAVDENGIPIKQMLSEEASRSADGTQGRLFEDPTQPVDPVIAKRMEEQAAEKTRLLEEQAKQLEIEEAYKQRQEGIKRDAEEARQMSIEDTLLKLQEELSTERVSKGQQRKVDRLRAPRGQRGAIDAEAVKDITEKFKAGIASARDMLASWKGAFTENELGVAMKALDNPKSLDTVVFMTPDEFHLYATGRTPEELNASYTPRLRESIREGLQSKAGLWDMPYLRIENDGQVSAHEGRHRMDVFKEQGYELVPVRLRKASGEGWGTWQPPSKIIPQDFKNSPAVIKELAKRDFPQIIHAKQFPQLPKSQRGAIDLDGILKRHPEKEVRDQSPEIKRLFLTQNPEALDWANYLEETTSSINTINPYEYNQFKDSTSARKALDLDLAQKYGLLDAFKNKYNIQGPKSQRGGIDIKAIGDSVKELVKSVTKPGIKAKDTPVKTKETVIESIPGHKDALKDYIPADPTASEILTDSLGDGDSNLKFTGVQSGATMTGIKYNSPLIQGIGKLYQNAQKRSEKLIRDFVYPVEYTFKKLSKSDIIDLSKVMKMEMFDGRLVDAQTLREAGFNDKQINAYTQMRDLFNRAYDIQAKALEAQGKKVPTKREAYLSSRWTGDWHVPVYTKDGKLVYYVAEKTRAGAHNALEYLKEQFDLDLDKSKVTYRAGNAKHGNLHDAYLTMLRVIDSNDPRAQAIKSVMEEALASEGFNALNQKQHFESKANIRGFQGDRPWVTDKTNAYDLFRSQFDYVKNAFTWTELQKATKTSKEVLSNDYLVQEQPNNVRYAQEYAKNKLGFGEANWVKEMESVANEMLGTSRQSFYNVVGDMKSFFIISKLGFNSGFIVANFIQPVFTLPWHANLISYGYKHNPFTTFVKGGLDAISGHMKYSLGLDMPMSNLGKEALRYAEDNGIVRRSMFDETANLGRHPIIEKAEKTGSATIQTVEHTARLNSFMGFVHHLDQSKMFSDPLKMFEKAEELTNAAMVDYRPGEGPMAFDKLGTTGEALKTLQTFKFNYYNQLHYFFKEAVDGRPRGLITFMALQAMLGGAIGLPLLQEMDDIWSMIRDNLPNDLHTKKLPMSDTYVKDFSIKQKMIETMPDWASYGGLSKLTGANFSSRFDAGNLADMSFDSLFPFIKDISNQASKVYNYTKEPGTSTGAEALYALAPPGPIQGLLETNMDAFKGPKTPEGNQVYLNPRDLRKQDANYVRTPEQESYRVLGLTELEEAKYKAKRYTQNQMERESDMRRKELADKFFDAVIKKEDKTRDKIIYQYMKYDGDPQTLIDRLDSDAMRRALPAEILQASKAQTLLSIQKAKRMKEVLNGFNK